MASETLPYASAERPNGRLSRLAIASLPASILGCPCLVAMIVDALLKTFFAAHMGRRFGIGLALCWMGLTTAMPIIAWVRVHQSRGRLTGIGFAWFALVISSLWWILLVAFLWVFSR